MKKILKRINLFSLQRVLRIIGWFVGIVVFCVTLLIAICNYVVVRHSKGRLYSDVNEIPYNKVGLLFGTSKYTIHGTPNPFFHNRIKAAADLYYAKKIDYIILSGDNQYVYYNEPKDMRRELRYMQVPDSVLILDYAGFRTFDSVVRCYKVFGQTKFTLISQEFQNQRAAYIARKSGLEVVGFNATDVDFRLGMKTTIREFFARVNVVLDIYLFRTQPKFLGKKVEL